MTLTVADLVRALSKLPPDAKLYRYEPSSSFALTEIKFDKDGPLFFQLAGKTYNVCNPHEAAEARLCFPYDTCEDGEPLDFGETPAFKLGDLVHWHWRDTHSAYFSGYGKVVGYGTRNDKRYWIVENMDGKPFPFARPRTRFDFTDYLELA